MVEWISKQGLIESEGLFCYSESDCETKIVNEMQKMVEYIDSIALVEGLEHKDPMSLRDVVGKANNLTIKNIKGKNWLAADLHFDPNKISHKLYEYLIENKAIPGSVSEWVNVDENGNQVDQYPTHFLVHPDLVPRIDGAGVANNSDHDKGHGKPSASQLNHATKNFFSINISNLNNIQKRSNNMTENKELENLKKENAELSAKNESLKKQIEDFISTKRDNLTNQLIERGIKKENIEGKSLEALELLLENLPDPLLAKRENKALNLSRKNTSDVKSLHQLYLEKVKNGEYKVN